MENCKEKIISIIRQQSLSSEESKLWEGVLEGFSDNSCSYIFEFIQTTPNGLRVLTDDLKNKVDALKNQDLNKWEEILKEEGKFLKVLKK